MLFAFRFTHRDTLIKDLAKIALKNATEDEQDGTFEWKQIRTPPF